MPSAGTVAGAGKVGVVGMVTDGIMEASAQVQRSASALARLRSALRQRIRTTAATATRIRTTAGTRRMVAIPIHHTVTPIRIMVADTQTTVADTDTNTAPEIKDEDNGRPLA